MTEDKETGKSVEKVADRLRGTKRYYVLEPYEAEREGTFGFQSCHKSEHEAVEKAKRILKARHNPLFPATDLKTRKRVPIEHELWIVRVEKVLTTTVQPEEQPEVTGASNGS